MKLQRGWQGVMTGFLLILTLVFAVPVRADGGPIVSNVKLWAQLEEGQQIAVVRLGEEDTVQVDLFVSLLDASGKSHEITFFLPLGSRPTAFDAVEENSHDFEATQTEDLDDRLDDAGEREETYQQDVRLSLLPGMLLTHGGGVAWLGLLLGFVDISSLPPFDTTFDNIVGGVIAPVATFQTEHSLIELYDIDADTGLEELIATTGLDPAVQETLRRLEGQQIAVITMQTRPAGKAGAHGYPGTPGQPGLHLAWTTRLVPDDEGGSYAYPLGTGSAWARPIELTRVYVVAPPGVDFRVAYPRLGKNRSGYVHVPRTYLTRQHFEPRIMQHTDTPSYAVDQAVGDFGRVWRVTYVQSNAAEDVVVTRVEDLLPEIRTALRRLVIPQWVTEYAWVAGLLAAIAIWVTAWRFVMSRRLGFPYHWLDPKLWGHAVGWAMVYLGSHIALLIIFQLVSAIMLYIELGLMAVMESPGPLHLMLPVSMAVCLPLLALTSLGIVSGFLFTLIARYRKSIPWRKAAEAYALVVIVSNVGYGLFALSYLALVGGL